MDDRNVDRVSIDGYIQLAVDNAIADGDEMTDKQRELLKAIIRDHTRRTTSSPEAARESLVEEGIITEDGNLTEEYGGVKAA